MARTIDAIACLAILIQARIPALLIGNPGPGKTANVHAVSEALDEPLEVVMANIREPADVGGWPLRTETGVVLDAPAWAKRLAKHGHGVIFFDELSTCAPAMQAACLRVIHEGVVGDLALPSGVARVAAMNPPDQAGGAGNDISAPLSNRFIHVQWPHGDIDYWATGMVSGWPTPEFPRLTLSWQTRIPYHRGRVAAFIHHRPELLHKLPKHEAQRSEPWPSERSWDMSATVMAAAEVTNENVRTMLLAGGIGLGPATEYLSWEAHLDLPDPEECLAHPDKVKIPKEGDKAYALFAGVASAVVANFTEERYFAVFKILGKVGNAPDLGMMAATTVMKHQRAVMPNLRSLPPELDAYYALMRDAGIFGGVQGR